MTIKFKAPTSYGGTAYDIGVEADFDKKTGEMLVRRGRAEVVKGSKPAQAKKETQAKGKNTGSKKPAQAKKKETDAKKSDEPDAKGDNTGEAAESDQKAEEKQGEQQQAAESGSQDSAKSE